MIVYGGQHIRVTPQSLQVQTTFFNDLWSFDVGVHAACVSLLTGLILLTLLVSCCAQDMSSPTGRDFLLLFSLLHHGVPIALLAATNETGHELRPYICKSLYNCGVRTVPPNRRLHKDTRK